MPSHWLLPPLILHPFAGGDSTEELLEGSRAAVRLDELRRPDKLHRTKRAAAVVGEAGQTDEESALEQKVFRGRYQEIRMLLFLGKDLCRWVDQSLDFLSRQREFCEPVCAQSLAAFAVESPPEHVRQKLERWGVADRRTVFARAFGIHGMFAEPPASHSLSPTFLANYHRYADHAWMCFLNLRRHTPLNPCQFEFELFASEEFAQKLSSQWEAA